MNIAQWNAGEALREHLGRGVRCCCSGSPRRWWWRGDAGGWGVNVSPMSHKVGAAAIAQEKIKKEIVDISGRRPNMSLRRSVSVPRTHLCSLSHRLCLSCSTSCACAFPTVGFRSGTSGPPMTPSALVCALAYRGVGWMLKEGLTRWHSGGFHSWD